MKEAAAMEQVREIGLRTSATSGALTRSGKRLTALDLRALPRMMAEMKASRPSQEIPPETALVWMDDWRRIAEQFGVKRMDNSLAALRLELKFLPQPDDIKARCEELMENERAQFLKDHPYTPCKECDGHGMRIRRHEGGGFEAYECECKKAWRRSCKSEPSSAAIERARVVGQ